MYREELWGLQKKEDSCVPLRLVHQLIFYGNATKSVRIESELKQ
jgi:hypothetical protein